MCHALLGYLHCSRAISQCRTATRGNISGAVMANKKLSVILNRETNTEGVKRQWRGVGECLVLSIMDSLFEGGMFTVKSFWWAGCGGPKSFMQEHYIMYILIKQSKHMVKIEDGSSLC